jgi:membrane-associated phospholipid phosphatase
VLVSRSTDPGFPSDHAAASIAIAVAVFLMHRRIGIVVVVVALLVCCSRVFVGAHYPGDVAVGALIGAGVTLLLWRPLALVPSKVNDAITWLIRPVHLPLPDAPADSGRTGPR